MSKLTEGSSIGATPPAGNPKGLAGKLKVLTHNRIMKCFCVTEGELHTVSSLNGACLLWVGLASAMFGALIGLVTSRAFAEKPMSPEAAVLSGPGSVLCFVLLVVFGVAAYLANKKSKTDIERIKKESNVEP